MIKNKDGIRPLVLGGVIGLLCAAGFAFGLLETWSARVEDRLYVGHPADTSISIIAIDDASITQIGRWPWPRKVHADIISALAHAGVKAIGYDVNFPEASDAENDSALATALKDAGNVVLPVELQISQQTGVFTYDSSHVLSPIPELSASAKATGSSNTPPESDGVMRRVPLLITAPDGSKTSSFVAEIARITGNGTRIDEAPLDASHRLIVNFAGAPFKNFRTISAVDVLRGKADLSPLKDGVVFVGSTASDLHDALLVPTSDGVLMPGVEIHASTFDTLIGRHWLQAVPPVGEALLIIICAIFVAFFGLRFGTRWNIVLTTVLWVVVVVASFMLFDRGWLVDIVWPTLAIGFSFAFVTLERRIAADRQRRELKSAFTRYVSSSVVESILKDPSKLSLGGERRRMSVLFSDIRGFTTISEGLSPESLVETLNVYLTRMTDIVFQNQGVLDKYIGDAVMAFWNAPFDQKNHAELAARTALTMQKALAEMNASKQFGGIELHIGVGVNTGDMVVGNVGGAKRFDYTVIGDNVNLGSRLEGLTKEYGIGIIFAESTVKDISNIIACRKLDKVAVKGKKEPVVIYEGICLKEEATAALNSLVADFESALDAYFAKDFTGAVSKCDAILRMAPNDGPTNNLKERAEHFMQEPPPADWVGTWVFTKK